MPKIRRFLSVLALAGSYTIANEWGGHHGWAISAKSHLSHLTISEMVESAGQLRSTGLRVANICAESITPSLTLGSGSNQDAG